MDSTIKLPEISIKPIVSVESVIETEPEICIPFTDTKPVEDGYDLVNDDIQIDTIKKETAPIKKASDENESQFGKSMISYINPSSKARIKSNYTQLPYNKYLSEMNTDESVACQRMEKSPLSIIKHPKVVISKSKIIKKNIFSSKVSLFTVKCEDINSEVERKLEDFLWLKEQIKASWPGYYVNINIMLLKSGSLTTKETLFRKCKRRDRNATTKAFSKLHRSALGE